MVTVVVPWRPGCPDRERAWRWVRAQYALKHPDWHVVEALAPDGPWCKATAVQPAVEAAPDGVVVVADADVWCDGLEMAVGAVTSGLAKWSLPHYEVRRLDQSSTSLLLKGGTFVPTFVEEPGRGLLGGGVVVARRETLLDVPLDPRFVGWGQEDAAWAVALITLHGLPWRGSADLTHLWHPSQPRMCRKTGSTASQELHRRYLRVRRKPDAMRALIEEGRNDARLAAQHAGHDHAPAAGHHG